MYEMEELKVNVEIKIHSIAIVCLFRNCLLQDDNA